MTSFFPAQSFMMPSQARSENLDDSDRVSHPSSHQTRIEAPSIPKRPRGSGIEYLMKTIATGTQLDSNNLALSDGAKRALSGLLSDHNIPVTTPTASWLRHQEPRKKRKPIETSMSDERVMQLAQEGELSFLASLLKVIEEEGGSITTKFLIKACCLAVEPARAPALCDAKEMVMTALHFLSQPFQPESNNFPAMPLIQCVQETPDLEKRSYEQYGDSWTTKDPTFLDQVLQLEQVFYNSIDYKFLAREHMCPTLPTGRDLLLLKGSPPAFCMGKSRKAAPPRRRKADDPAASLVDDGPE